MPFNQDWEPCYLCGRQGAEKHHAFGGNGRRELSDKYDLVYHLCDWCHRTGPDSVHNKPKGVKAMAIKQSAQMRFENEYGSREDFIRIFGRNYL